ncbi:hypothetical protein TEA_016692 [Camellia sinensis var. sinensis]|uniref:t-SNARE coiled-coil homology domain-containing protein n=1 Tax=Camellia sinensis var. sinensis TaxID=542762 RepID=A0A4S4DR08_CAMSN|nr:hypothetical protein TEA_016692 [Camellia sinensis var. sinensis]
MVAKQLVVCLAMGEKQLRTTLWMKFPQECDAIGIVDTYYVVTNNVHWPPDLIFARIDDNMEESLTNVESAHSALLRHLNQISSNRWLRIQIFAILIFFLMLDLATSGKGGIGTYIGICMISCAFGVADAHVQGGMVSDLSFMLPELMQVSICG